MLPSPRAVARERAADPVGRIPHEPGFPCMKAYSAFVSLSRHRTPLLVLLLVLVSWGSARWSSAQEPQFRHLGPNDGLASHWVPAIFQDGRGFMWFGTANGLNRFDGHTFRLYRHDRTDPGSLADNYITRIGEDRTGAMWVGSRSGLSRYDRRLDRFDNFLVQEVRELAARRQVHDFLDDSRGTFWVATSEGLMVLDRSTGEARPYDLGFDDAGELPYVQVLLEDTDARIWVGSQRYGLIRIDPSTGKVTRIRLAGADAEEPLSDVRALVQAPSGHLWIGTQHSGLVKLDPRNGRAKRFVRAPESRSGLLAHRVARLLLEADSGLWVGTENGGLSFLDFRTEELTHYRANADDPVRYNSKSVWSLAKADDGTLWIGTFSGGIFVSRPNSGAIRHFATVRGLPSSLGFNSVVAFAEDGPGTVWLATDGGGLNRMDRARGTFERFSTETSNLNRDAVLAVARAHDGVWVGTWGGGISRFDPATRQFTAYTPATSGLPDANIFSLLEDSQRRLWIGTWSQGLVLFDRRDSRFTTYRFTPPDVPQSQIWLLHELSDRRLAVGTRENGLVLFDPETRHWTTYKNDRREPSLSSDEVRAVLESEPGILWIGTAGGLDRLDLRANRVTRYTERDGLPSSMISGLAQDPAGHLWVSTDNGVARLEPGSGLVKHFTISDGLQGREFTARAYLQASDGVLFFGGSNGFNTINPRLVLRNDRKPPVVLTGFQLFNRPVAIGGERSPLQSQISEADQLVLSHRQSVFTIEYTALEFSAPDKSQYEYMLEGFDSDWSFVGGSRSATYTNIPPGSYAFRVRARNEDGVWNEEGAALRITITPPFWRTWWFRTLAALVVVGAVGLVVRGARNRRWYLEAMNARLAEASEQDRQAKQYLAGNVREMLDAMQAFAAGDHSVTLQVHTEDEIGKLRQGFNTVVADRKRAEEELRQSQKMEAVGRLAGGVAHDFNNLLTVIKGNTSLALLDATDAELREELEEVQRAAERASSLTRQLLAFSRKQILQPRPLSLNEVVSDLGRILRRTVGEDIELRIALEPQLALVQADPGQVQQVLLNLVVNARDAMPRGGVLEVETRNVEAEAALAHPEAEPIPYVALSVSDTGEGMEPRVMERVFEPFFTTKEQGKGTGLGLSTVYGIVKQSGGYVEVASEPGLGSRFTVYLPRAQARPEVREVVAGAGAGGGSETVLLVEDEDAVRLLASRVLQRAGYTVLTAASGEEAMEVTARYMGPIDLLLTDVVMPGMSGRELAQQLLPQRPGMRLLYTSGYTEDATVRHGVSGLATAFLEKPFGPDALTRKVREVLEAPVPIAARGAGTAA
jgi:signal transduction histidine kinase/ligand-binding sensor domain-containing protein